MRADGARWWMVVDGGCDIHDVKLGAVKGRSRVVIVFIQSRVEFIQTRRLVTRASRHFVTWTESKKLSSTSISRTQSRLARVVPPLTSTRTYTREKRREGKKDVLPICQPAVCPVIITITFHSIFHVR